MQNKVAGDKTQPRETLKQATIGAWELGVG